MDRDGKSPRAPGKRAILYGRSHTDEGNFAGRPTSDLGTDRRRADGHAVKRARFLQQNWIFSIQKSRIVSEGKITSGLSMSNRWPIALRCSPRSLPYTQTVHDADSSLEPSKTRYRYAAVHNLCIMLNSHESISSCSEAERRHAKQL